MPSLEQNWFRRKKGMKLKRIKSRKTVSVGFTLGEPGEEEKEPEAEGKGRKEEKGEEER